MPLPPRWLRRLVLAPAVVVLAALAVTTLPLWLIAAAAASPLVPGWFRPLRALWVMVVYLVWDALALVALFGLWLGSGLGWALHRPGFRRAHYAVTGWFLRALFTQVRWALRLRIDVVGTSPDRAPTRGPVVVASRHAGPGDSFILVHALINWFRRAPRIVLKDTLQWDPAIDVMLNRLPNQFIAAPPPGAAARADISAAIGALASDLGDDDALVIFPEGGNFSPRRRLRRIEHLRTLGLHAMARRAEDMQHVVAPRPGGLFAALDQAPHAGVIFVAHTGLDQMLTVGDVWRELPMDKRIVMNGWWVPPEDVPTDREERLDWLFGWWARIDEWIDTHRDDPAGAVRQVRPRRRGSAAPR